MACVRICDGGRRIEVRGYPKRVRPEDIEHTLRAVLWRMAAEGDPGAIAHWRRWAEANEPEPRELGTREPLKATMAEILAHRQAA